MSVSPDYKKLGFLALGKNKLKPMSYLNESRNLNTVSLKGQL